MRVVSNAVCAPGQMSADASIECGADMLPLLPPVAPASVAFTRMPPNRSPLGSTPVSTSTRTSPPALATSVTGELIDVRQQLTSSYFL